MNPALSHGVAAVALLIAVHAEGAQPAPTGSQAGVFLSRVAGVYKERFRNGFVNGESYESEDILEVVPVSNDAAYVRMDLEFFNGHSGEIFGVATYGNDSLVYDNGAPGERRCVVEYAWTGDKVVTRADYERTPGCLSYHGARGSLDGAKFSVSGKRAIRYMERLRNSREFASAMEEYRKRK